MTEIIRQSPSGEPILNPDGGGLIPGEGLVMRAKFSQASIADGFLKSMIDDSYELVFKGLKRSEREDILGA